MNGVMRTTDWLQLGCFLLTEMQAGVLSGLIVETTADWDPALQRFILHTPSDKAAKNWISQVNELLN
jgi:acyl-CoA oxidase